MTFETRTWLLPLAATLALLAGSAPGQEPSPPVPEEEPTVAEKVRSSEIFRFGSHVVIGADEIVEEVILINGTATIEGEVTGDVVVVGSAVLADTAKIWGDVVVVGGRLEVAADAEVEGDLVSVGTEFAAARGFVPDGEQVVIDTADLVDRVTPILRWFSEGLLLGRPIVPTLGWVWVFVALITLVYLAINLVFEQPVRACSEFLVNKPLTAALSGLAVLVLVAPVSVLLALSLVGLPLVPLLALALLVAGVFGRVSVARWLGQRMVTEEPTGGALQASRSLILGLAVICVAYMVPVVGFITWFSIGVLGLGAVVATVVGGLRREHPPSSRSPVTVTVSNSAGPDSYSGAAPAGSYRVASFAPRLGAVVLDAILVVLATALLDVEVEAVIGIFLVYNVALWAWKSTTIGGIICQLRVVRSDGAPLSFADALVRGLASIFSVAVVGLGWFWVLWDPSLQSWHDKIAKTFVVRVQPSSMPSSGADLPTNDGPEAPPETEVSPATDVPQGDHRSEQ